MQNDQLETSTIVQARWSEGLNIPVAMRMEGRGHKSRRDIAKDRLKGLD